MVQKQRRVNEIANETGISRNTITSTSQNYGKMIQLETINKLCQSLNVSPTDFFEYVPFDFDYTFDEGELVPGRDYDHGEAFLYNSSLFINVSANNSRIDTIELQGSTELEGFNDGYPMIGVSLHPSDNIQLEKLHSYLKQMSVAFVEDVKKAISNNVETVLTEKNNHTIYPDFLIEFDETRQQFETKIKNRSVN